MTYETMTHDELIATLHRRDAVIRVLEKDAHDARNQLQAAWARQESIGASVVDQKLHAAAANACEDCRYKIAYNEWIEKTDWIRNKLPGKFLGMHLAEAMSRYIEGLEAEVKAHRKINDSFAQPSAIVEPVAWVRRHPDGALSAEFLEHAAIEGVRKRSGAWVPLYTAPVAAQPQPSGDVLEYERTAFEAWHRNNMWSSDPGPERYKTENGYYLDMRTQHAWRGWQARAALAAQPSGQARAARPSSYVNSAGIVASDGPGEVVKKLDAAWAAAGGQAQKEAIDAAFDAVRKHLCRLPRYSFFRDDSGAVRQANDISGNWIEFDAAHELFDPVAVDAARNGEGGA